jgi:hypothetical protein
MSVKKHRFWFDITRGVVQSLTTEKAASALLPKLTKAEFGFLASPAGARLDPALKKMCLAVGESDVKDIFNNLHMDRWRALMSRKTAYSIWRAMGR